MKQLNDFEIVLEQAAAVRRREAIADIAYLAGANRYHSGDSREDVQQFLRWADEFESLRRMSCGAETYDGKNYMEAIEDFTLGKLRDSGHHPAPWPDSRQWSNTHEQKPKMKTALKHHIEAHRNPIENAAFDSYEIETMGSFMSPGCDEGYMVEAITEENAHEAAEHCYSLFGHFRKGERHLRGGRVEIGNFATLSEARELLEDMGVTLDDAAANPK